jgi:tetratricopeptide (TPR) repeat protein
MMNNNKQENIDAFLLGELKGEELNDFNEMIKQNPDMAKELRFQAEVMESIRDEKKLALRETLNEVLPDSSLRFTILKYSRTMQLAAAVVVMAMIIGGSFLYESVFNTSSSSQQLFEEYFTPEYELMTVRSGNSSNSTLEQGMNYFANRDYNNAIETFEEVPDNMLAKLYSGFSYMHLDNYQQAEQLFSEIVDDGDSMFTDQAAWHLGLCYLATDKEEDAIKIFNVIANGNTFYKVKALELITRMGED